MDHQNWNQYYFHLDKKKSDKSQSHNKPKSKEIKLENKIEEGKLSHTKFDKEFGNLIRNYRSNQKISQKDLAQRLNINHKIINGIETGNAIYNPKIMRQLKQLLKK